MMQILMRESFHVSFSILAKHIWRINILQDDQRSSRSEYFKLLSKNFHHWRKISNVFITTRTWCIILWWKWDILLSIALLEMLLASHHKARKLFADFWRNLITTLPKIWIWFWREVKQFAKSNRDRSSKLL
jgi:hypothetical protein